MSAIGSPAVAVSGVTKIFGATVALDDVSFEIRRGEVAVLLGPNGAGKTTAVSLMLGLRRPTKGTIRVLGGVPGTRAIRVRTGAMLQDSGVPESLKVREIVALFCRLYRSRLTVAEAVALAQLQDKSKALVGTLSSGQKQRLYGALAMLGEPDVLFLDEPTVAMDVEHRRFFWKQIKASTDRGRTVVLTTHYLEEADAVADRVLILARGRLAAQGTPSDIKAKVSGKHLRFRSANVTEPALRALPGVQSVAQANGRWHVLTLKPEQSLRSLFLSSVTIEDLEVTALGLEEAFLLITGAALYVDAAGRQTTERVTSG